MKGALLCLLLSACAPIATMQPFLATCAMAVAGQTDDGVPIVQMYCQPERVK